MEFLTSKWIIGLYILISLLIILLIIGRKSVHSEIIINGSADEVWKVLTDTKYYSEWNSVMLLLEGEVKEGNSVKYKFTQEKGNSYDIPSNVVQIVPEKLLNQAGGTFGILTFNHRYIMEDINGNTKLTIHEDYKGIMVPFWNSKPVQLAYERLNQDIKKRVETLNQ